MLHTHYGYQLNSTVHTSTGITPFEAVFGRKRQTAYGIGLETRALAPWAVGRGRVVEDVDLRFGGNDFTYRNCFTYL